MQLKDTATGIEIDLSYDGDGFPIINISLGGGFQGENQRPAVEVTVDDVMIHDMFNEEDRRWAH